MVPAGADPSRELCVTAQPHTTGKACSATNRTQSGDGMAQQATNVLDRPQAEPHFRGQSGDRQPRRGKIRHLFRILLRSANFRNLHTHIRCILIPCNCIVQILNPSKKSGLHFPSRHDVHRNPKNYAEYPRQRRKSRLGTPPCFSLLQRTRVTIESASHYCYSARLGSGASPNVIAPAGHVTPTLQSGVEQGISKDHAKPSEPPCAPSHSFCSCIAVRGPRRCRRLRERSDGGSPSCTDVHRIANHKPGLTDW